MINKKSWEEFRECGLLWWINQTLHMFGWAIVIELDDGNITNAYPARVKFRGFPEKSNSEGYIRVSKYLKENADDLYNESIE